MIQITYRSQAALHDALKLLASFWHHDTPRAIARHAYVEIPELSEDIHIAQDFLQTFAPSVRIT